MEIDFHPSVLAFLHSLDEEEASDIYRLIEMLSDRGHTLSMPVSKPIGKGLFELRIHGRPAFRLLYGFYDRQAIVVVAMKKQKPSIDPRDIRLALERLRVYCTT